MRIQIGPPQPRTWREFFVDVFMWCVLAGMIALGAWTIFATIVGSLPPSIIVEIREVYGN
jgi:hypothetical protein